MTPKRSWPIAAAHTVFFPTRRWPVFAPAVSTCGGWKTAFRSGARPGCRSSPAAPDQGATRDQGSRCVDVIARCPRSAGNVLATSMLALHQDSLERRSLARNELLFRQGDKVTAIYFIEEGRLRLERGTFYGRVVFLGTTPTGEFFVEAALFADTFHCEAVATEPSRVRVYPKAMVLNALRTDPASAMSFLADVAHQVIELRQRLELMKVRSAKERLMLYLDAI